MLTREGAMLQKVSAEEKLAKLKFLSWSADPYSKAYIQAECEFKEAAQILAVWAWLDKYPDWKASIQVPPGAAVLISWDRTPPHLKELATQGGDEDLVLIIPPEIEPYTYTSFFRRQDDLVSYELPDGTLIQVSCHA